MSSPERINSTAARPTDTGDIRVCADNAFRDAIGFDESQNIDAAISAYEKAAENYFRIYKNDKSIKKRLEDIISRMETLKGVGKKVSKESADFVLPSPPTNTLTSRNSPTTKIDRPPQNAPNISPLSPPSSEISLTKSDLNAEEIVILCNSSTINGKLYQPWMNGEEKKEPFRFDQPWEDPDGLLTLSKKQIDAGATWMRPRAFIGIHSSIESNVKPIMINSITPLSITQELVADCSFVASLCIAAAFEQRFKRPLISNIIYPQDTAGNPIYNGYGKYLVKLHLNGILRKVTVDDQFPVGSNGRLLCSYSSNHNELWVSIVEKAYLKVCGGYDFPGSNSGIDLYALTGWIPEQVFFKEDSKENSPVTPSSTDDDQDHTQSEERAWERILSAHKYGDCLITIATSSTLTEEEEESTGLVSGHAYAVLDVRQAGNLKMLCVKNPWSKRPWKGRFSASQDLGSWTYGLKGALEVTDSYLESMERMGVFWLEFKDCRKYYKSFILNWNPKLFSFKTTVHGLWPSALGPANDTYFIGDNPQYILHVDKNLTKSTSSVAVAGAAMNQGSAPLWLLLTRHVTRKEGKKKDPTALTSMEPSARDGDFMTLHVYRGNRRLYTATKQWIRGLYTNDPHILVRVDVTCGQDESTTTTTSTTSGDLPSQYLDPMLDSQSFVLVLSQIDKIRDVAYSLTVLSILPFRLSTAPLPPPMRVDVSGAWTEISGGGSPSYSTFLNNPQYRLDVPKRMRLHIQLRCPKESQICGSISIVSSYENGSVSRGGGRRVDAVPVANEVCTSGDYRKCYSCIPDRTFEPGVYTLILSAYTPDMRGTFCLSVSGDIQPILSPADGTAAGCANHGKYSNNPVFIFQTTSVISIIARMLLPSSSSTNDDDNSSSPSRSISNNLSLFPWPQNNSSSTNSSNNPTRLNIPPINEAVTSTEGGVYTSRPSGLSLEYPSLPIGQWAFVPSTFSPTEQRFQILFYSSVRVDVTRIR